MEKNSIIFDGECNLCNGIIGWLMRFAPADLFEFIPFQSPKGQKMLMEYDFPTQELATVILFDENGPHTHSDGFLKIIAKIPKWRLVASLLAYIPKIIRDTIYNLASRNRVRWFGKSKACTLSLENNN
jgi:predicted DCC family thiol-disulfide oxidoreductase YuxK